MVEEIRCRPRRPTLTLLQMMKLVVFAAVASLCVAPMFRLAEAGVVPWPYVLMGEGVGIPVVLAIVAFPLLRAGAGERPADPLAPPHLVRHCPGSGGSPAVRPVAPLGKRRHASDHDLHRGRAGLSHLDPGLRIESTPMKLVIHPAVGPDRLEALLAAAPGADWVNARRRPRPRRPCPGRTVSWARSRPRCWPVPTGCGGSRRSRSAWSITCSRSWRRTPAC